MHPIVIDNNHTQRLRYFIRLVWLISLGNIREYLHRVDNHLLHSELWPNKPTGKGVRIFVSLRCIDDNKGSSDTARGVIVDMIAIRDDVSIPVLSCLAMCSHDGFVFKRQMHGKAWRLLILMKYEVDVSARDLRKHVSILKRYYLF